MKSKAILKIVQRRDNAEIQKSKVEIENVKFKNKENTVFKTRHKRNKIRSSHYS